MMVTIVTNCRKGHLTARKSAPLAFHGLWRNNSVIIYAIVVNAGNLHCQFAHIPVSQRHCVANSDIQQVGHTNTEEGFSGLGHTEVLTILGKVYEALNFLIRRNKEYLFRRSFKLYIHAGLVEEENVFRLTLHSIPECLLLFGRLSLREIDSQIIGGNVLELICDKIRNGIPQAKARQQQRCATTDTDQHHQHPLAIAEYIAQHYLIEEAKVPPEGQVLQENLFTGGRRFGADQLCSNLLQRAAATIPGHQQDHSGIHSNHSQAQRPIDLQGHIGHNVQNDAVGIP